MLNTSVPRTRQDLFRANPGKRSRISCCVT